jgi:hypothetical protein
VDTQTEDAMASPLLWIRRIVLVHCILLAGLTEGAVHAIVAGGAGGTAFVDPPQVEGAWIAAVLVYVGAAVHSVQTIYESRDRTRVASPRRGGPGGLPRLFELEPDEHIVAVSGRRGERLHSIRFHTNKRASPEYGTAAGTPYRIDVQPGQTVIGLAGRAGQNLDAVGLAIAIPDSTPAHAGVREGSRAGMWSQLPLPSTGRAASHGWDAPSPVAP